MMRFASLLLAATALTALSAAPGQDAADKEKVALLVKTLRQGEPKAAYLLGQMGPAAKDAIPVLIEMLQREPRPGDSLADNSAIALGKIGAEAVPALIRVLQDKKATVAWPHAASALKAIGPPAREAVPALVEVAKAPNKDVLTPCLAVDALGAIGPDAKDAVPELVDLLRHNRLKHPNGRTHVVVALGKIGPGAAEATRALQETRERADVILQMHIDEALERIGKK